MYLRKVFSALTVSAVLSTVILSTSTTATAAPGDSVCDLSSGNGSSGTPYLLSTEQDMLEMADCIDPNSNSNYFELSNSIHLTSDWTPVDFEINSSYSGGLNGGGFTISGLNIPSTSEAGLFSRAYRTSIGNLYLEVDSVTGTTAGSLAAVVGDASVIQNVHVRASGNISGSSDVGGVFGSVSSANITVNNVSFVSPGSVTSSGGRAGGIAGLLSLQFSGGLSAITDVSGTNAGGIAGTFITSPDPSTVSGFSFKGSVLGTDDAGGIFGEFTNTGATVAFQNASVIGTVESTNNNPGALIGDLVGGNTAKIGTLNVSTSFVSVETKKNGATTTLGAVVSPYASGVSVPALTNVFRDENKATFANTNTATGKSDTQLKTLSTFTGSSFDMETLAGYVSSPSIGDKWIISSDLNDGFPVLRSAYDSLVYGAPYRPQSLVMTPTSEGFNLTFDEPIYDGGAAITSYEYSTDNGSNWSSLTSTTTSGVVTGEITGLSPETSYPVTVRAVNTFGDSPAALGATAVTSKAVATTPAPYAGPLVSGMKPGSKASFIANGTETVTFVGERLGSVSAASIGSLPAEIIESLATEFSIRVPTGLTPGTYDLVIESSLGNLTYLDAITIDSSQSTNSVGYGEVSAWTKRISDSQVKVYVKYPTVGEKVRISHQVGGNGDYSTVYVRTTSRETMEGLRIVEGVGTYVVRTINLSEINRIRVTVGDEVLVQVRYNN